jgi:hypothetical protein
MTVVWAWKEAVVDVSPQQYSRCCPPRRPTWCLLRVSWVVQEMVIPQCRLKENVGLLREEGGG